METVIVAHPDLPDGVSGLLQSAFPDDPYDQREFWPEDSVHALVHDDGQLVAHAGYMNRTLYLPDRAIETAYVEYVAAEPRRSGYGTAAMRAIAEEIERRGFALAGLGTDPETAPFYERLGWRLWRGPTAYRGADGTVVPTPDEKPMVLDLGANVDLDQPIECDWRPVGDIW